MKVEVLLSRLRQRVFILRQERAKLYRILLGREKLIRGSLVEKYKVCGNPGCRCAKGERHGPFKYLSISVGNKTRMIFIRRGDEGRVSELAGNYRRYRQARSKLLRINQEITNILDRMERLRAISYGGYNPYKVERRKEGGK